MSSPWRVSRRKYTDWIAPVFVILAVLAAWEMAVVTFQVPTFILPAPSSVVQEVMQSWSIYVPHTLATLVPILVGFAVGSLGGIVFAVILDVSPTLRRALYPLIIATQTTPKIAIAPLLLVWLGTGVMPKVVIVALLAFFPVLINVVAGLEGTDAQLIVLAQSVDASQYQIYRSIKVPSAVPYLFAGLKLAMTVSVIGAIVGEWVASDRGLGYLLVYYNAVLDTPALFGVLIVLVVIASALFGLLVLVERHTSWEMRQSRGRGAIRGEVAAQAGM